MTREEAVRRAKEIAAAKSWTWLEPSTATRSRAWFFGRARWTVVSNAESRGSSARVVVDDVTGEDLEAGFSAAMRIWTSRKRGGALVAPV